MVCPHCHTVNLAGMHTCGVCNTILPTQIPEERPTVAIHSSWASTGLDGEAPVTTSEFAPGLVLGGRYEILDLHGEGGMGTVYKAKDREVDREIALKVIRADLTRRPDLVRRFKQELLLARKISHKNVIRIF